MCQNPRACGSQCSSHVSPDTSGGLIPGVWLVDAGRTCKSQGWHAVSQPFWKERAHTFSKGSDSQKTRKWNCVVDSGAHQELFLKSGFDYEVKSGKNWQMDDCLPSPTVSLFSSPFRHRGKFSRGTCVVAHKKQDCQTSPMSLPVGIEGRSKEQEGRDKPHRAGAVWRKCLELRKSTITWICKFCLFCPHNCTIKHRRHISFGELMTVLLFSFFKNKSLQ